MTLWTRDPQVPQSIGFSSQEYWSGVPFPSPGDLPNPGIKPASLMSPTFSTSATWEAHGEIGYKPYTEIEYNKPYTETRDMTLGLPKVNIWN